MKAHELPRDPGRQQKRKRLGRGHGTGHGKTAGKGHKGHKARSGGGKRSPFEGGQIPLVRRLPKGGFKNPGRVEYEVVNLSSLEKKFEAGATVDLEALRGVRLAAGNMPVKLLANGELTKALTVRLDKASQTAVAKVEKAGGSFESTAGMARKGTDEPEAEA